jgi:DNA-binding LytR/AlgR family response regulator
MRIAICEDQDAEQARLTNAIKDWASARKVQVDILCYSNAEAFIVAWPDMSFDLAFLDIQMKNMTGIQLADFIRQTDKNMLIVFVTSYSQYVLKGYDVNALHYLIKPLSSAKLLPILDKAHVIWRSRQRDVLLVANGTGQIKLPFGNIFYISMWSHIAEIHTDGDAYELRKTALELSNQLPSHFIRCHRSYIVNLLKADCVYKDSIMLSNGKKLPISRNNSKLVNDAFVRLYTE